MKTQRIVRVLFLFLATSMLAVPTNAQTGVPQASPQSMHVAESAQSAASYQCIVTTKDGGIETKVVQEKSEDAAKTAAVQKVGSRSALKSVSCARSAGSTVSAADSSVQKAGVKTRAPTPPIIEPTRSGMRSGIEFEKDGSCRLSQEAMQANRDARDKCRGLPGSDAVCPVDFCSTLR